MAKMFRRSQRRLPADLATGDVCLDARLQELDAHLAGSAAVRRPTLQEARDFLFEARDRALAAGRSPAEAAAEAVAALGDAREIAEEQRTRRRGIFWRTALTIGVFFGAVMFLSMIAVTQPLAARSPFAAILMAAALGVLGGSALGGLIGRLAADSAASAESLEADGDTAGVFRIASPQRGIGAAWRSLVMFAALTLLFAAGLFGRGPMAGVEPRALVVLCSLGFCVVVGFVWLTQFDVVVTPEEVVVRGWLGSTRISRQAVRETRDYRLLTRLASGLPPSLIRFGWEDERGRMRHRRIYLPTGIANGDRLRAWFADAAEANAAAGAVSRAR